MNFGLIQGKVWRDQSKGQRGYDLRSILFRGKGWFRVLAAAFLLSLGGCLGLHLFSGDGGETKTETIKERETQTTTLGKELIDLERAYKQGIISKKEYDKAKKKLIDKYVD
jgi:hypothetical protein